LAIHQSKAQNEASKGRKQSEGRRGGERTEDEERVGEGAEDGEEEAADEAGPHDLEQQLAPRRQVRGRLVHEEPVRHSTRERFPSTIVVQGRNRGSRRTARTSPRPPTPAAGAEPERRIAERSGADGAPSEMRRPYAAAARRESRSRKKSYK